MRPPVTKYLRQYPWMILVICMLGFFLVKSELSVLINSPYPFLYGTIGQHSRFEEATLYAQYINNFSLDHFFKLDYSGADSRSAIAPYPYFAIFLLGVSHYLTGGNISWAIFLVHCLIIVEFILAYYCVRLFIKKDIVAAAIGAFIILDYNMADFELLGFWLIVMACLLHYAYTLVRQRNLRAAWPWLALSMIILMISFFRSSMPTWYYPIDFIWQHLLLGWEPAWQYWMSFTGHEQYYLDIYSLRFISPLLPKTLLFGVMLCLAHIYKRSQQNQTIPKWLWITGASLIVANVYTYYLNTLLLAPLVLWWLVAIRKTLWQQRGFMTGLVLTSSCALAPFMYAYVKTHRIPEYIEFVYRAAARGTIAFAGDNYPVLPYEYWILLVVIIGIYGWALLRKSIKPNFDHLFPLVLFILSIVIFHANYIVDYSVPQAYLAQRYFVPSIILALLPLVQNSFVVVAQKSQWFSNVIFVLLISYCFIIFNVTATGRYLIQLLDVGPAQADVANPDGYLARIKPLIHNDPEAIVVSNDQRINLLAPAALGVHTLSPDPINTVGTHASFLEQFALQAKLLGQSQAEYLQFVGNPDIVGMPITRFDAQTSGQIISQVTGPVYTLPADWITANPQIIAEAYSTLDLTRALNDYHPIYLCLINADISPEIAPYFELIDHSGEMNVYRQRL